MTITKNIIAISLVTLVVFVILIDIYFYLNKIPGDTISNIIRNWAYDRCWALAWVWGVLAGHLFLGRESTAMREFGREILGEAIPGPVFLLGLTLLMFALGLAFRLKLGRIGMGSLLIVGVIFGNLFWSQV